MHGKTPPNPPTYRCSSPRRLANASSKSSDRSRSCPRPSLARHDAESDGRSPRGAHPTPPRLADSIISSEMLEATIQPKVKKQTTNMHLADLPWLPKHIKKLNFPPSEEEVTHEDSIEAVKRSERTSSGIPLPFSDMSCGGGIFHARMLRKHSELFEGQSTDLRKEDTERLFRGFQLVDVDELVVRSTRKRLLLEAIRLGLVSLEGEQEGNSIEASPKPSLSKTSFAPIRFKKTGHGIKRLD